METYKSDINRINCNIGTVFAKLSNPSIFQEQIEKNLDRMPDDARENMSKVKFEPDGISIESPMGPLKMAIQEVVEPNKIVFGAAQSPVAFNLIINLTEVDEENTDSETHLQLDLPLMLRAMVGGKLKDAAKMFGEMLTKLPYKEL
ncbi:MAG: hypothetical protein J5523_08455 [Muribaculaceae bacterium]|nr:hypothetical protein [Muribaculaceae bacterium]